MKKIFLILALSLNFLGMGIAPVLALDENPPKIGIENDLLPGSKEYETNYTDNDRKAFLQNEVLGSIVRTLTSVISGVAVLMIVIAGYEYLTARGNEEQIKKAHKTVVMAVIALFIMLFSYSIVSIIANLTSLI